MKRIQHATPRLPRRYNVQFAYMNSATNFVKKHKDSSDVDYQYALSLGAFSGAKLRAYSASETSYQDFDYKDRILRMDGRLAHEVLLEGFVGERYTCIWYKNYDKRYAEDKPILSTPCLVDESRL